MAWQLWITLHYLLSLSANILLDRYFEAKLGDLGQAKYATKSSGDGSTAGLTHFTKADTATKQFGTKAYIDPYAGPSQMSIKSDIYALGVVSPRYYYFFGGLKFVFGHRLKI